MEPNHVGMFEQDQRTGAVYRDHALVWPTAPVAFECLRDAPLSVGGTLRRRDLALLFMDGVRSRVTTIPDVVLQAREFRTRRPGHDERIPPEWITRAREALRLPS